MTRDFGIGGFPDTSVARPAAGDELIDFYMCTDSGTTGPLSAAEFVSALIDQPKSEPKPEADSLF